MAAIIITGMGRSGTSLIASLVQQAGVHIGDKLLAASDANPRGYFEDVHFYEFHDIALHERGQTYLYVDADFKFEPTSSEAEYADKLIAERCHRPIWGWKDPRTSLFLDFWSQRLPEARYLFVYRHPVEVLLSLIRRGEFDTHPSFVAGLTAWRIYNSRILNFYRQNRDHSLLVHIGGVVEQPEVFALALQDKLQLGTSVDQKTFEQIYHSDELQNTEFPPELTVVLSRMQPELFDLYRQLQLQADLPGGEPAVNSANSAHFSSLVHFAESIMKPTSLTVQNSLMPLSLWLLIPDTIERILSRYNCDVQEAQRKIDQFWLHSQQLHRLNMEQSAELARQADRIESLEAKLARIHGKRIWKWLPSYQSLKSRWKKVA